MDEKNIVEEQNIIPEEKPVTPSVDTVLLARWVRVPFLAHHRIVAADLFSDRRDNIRDNAGCDSGGADRQYSCCGILRIRTAQNVC